MIVTEANAEARKILRDAITDKETLMGDVRRIQALLRSALDVVQEAPGAEAPAQVAAPSAPSSPAAVPGSPVGRAHGSGHAQARRIARLS